MYKIILKHFIAAMCITPLTIISSIGLSQDHYKLIDHPAVASNIRLLETWIQAQIDYGKMPGVSVGIVYNGDLIYKKGFGYANIEKKIPTTPETTYRIASQSKMFTALGIMILKDEGKLRLDDPVNKFLPWLKLIPVRETDPPITIFQLLTHSSGLSRDIANHWTDFQFPDRAEFRALAETKLKLIYSPSTVWKYSNNGYTLLGMVIEAVSGRLYEDFIGERILTPLQMSSTRVVHDKTYQSQLAAGYGRKKPDGSLQKFDFIDAKATNPMGGMSSNVVDMARFMSWQMKLLYTDKKEIIDPYTLREMMRIQYVDQEWGWGLGFEIYRTGDHRFIGHGGGQVGYRTHTSVDPIEKIGVTVCINSLDGETYPRQTWSISDRIFEWFTPAIKIATAEKSPPLSQSLSNDIEGIYSSIWEDTYVQYNNGKPVIMNPNSPDPKMGAWILEPVSDQTFRIVSAPRFLEMGENIVFKRDGQGKVTGYESGVGGHQMTKYK